MADARKTVLITGFDPKDLQACAPGGIGNSIAREFHSKGLRVFATSRDASNQLSDLSALGIETLSLDIDSAEDIAAVKKDIELRTNGKLDFLVNNAGRNYTVPALDVNMAEVRKLFETNLFGVMALIQAVSPLLVAAKGTIVQIGSVAAYIPYVFGAVYNASKAALHAYSDTLRLEMAPYGVKVVVVVTGGVQSRIARRERQLPPTSLYLPIDGDYQRRLKHSQEGAMANADYAKSVVSQVLPKAHKKRIWEGNKSWLVWFVHSFYLSSYFDWYMSKEFGLAKLAKLISTNKKKA
ncbi:MAG: hypothetical protein M1824_003913 [Vezdaea acicularis]|nr:MAG: hypothetical protein M1824_003913 [Vezdaea acicularis]